ncbi:hypothetical protein Cgig2_015544 [Carnegiea gigantea]|uniref:CCHC-type domain-containing protein n=1 Tax=Carnegiea gigantea TaxID=171969 RepID=A0A9Q1JJR5_9CARY|nr:hypothetical protein Cgig2_015544 [Carnegiea gigantea]
MASLEINCTQVSSCIRGCDIPFRNISKDTTMALATNFGYMEEYREDDDLGWSRYVVFRTQFSIHDPLPRGAVTDFGEKGARWVPFKYEKLPNFCYRCGRLGHVEGDCDEAKEYDLKGQYGDWLRALPVKFQNPKHGGGEKGGKLMVDFGGKGNLVDSNKENMEDKTKPQARRSLKDKLEAVNLARQDASGESKASSKKGETEVESAPRKVHHIIWEGSDHHPILLDTEVQGSRNEESIKFEAVWTKKEGFAEVVAVAWNETEDVYESFSDHLQACEETFKAWGKVVFGVLPEKAKNLRKKF